MCFFPHVALNRQIKKRPCDHKTNINSPRHRLISLNIFIIIQMFLSFCCPHKGNTAVFMLLLYFALILRKVPDPLSRKEVFYSRRTQGDKNKQILCLNTYKSFESRVLLAVLLYSSFFLSNRDLHELICVHEL